MLLALLLGRMAKPVVMIPRLPSQRPGLAYLKTLFNLDSDSDLRPSSCVLTH